MMMTMFLCTFLIMSVDFVCSSSRKHSSLHEHHRQSNYCTQDSVFLGAWKYHKLTTVSVTSSNPFSACPNTFSDVSGFPSLSDQIRKWTCWNQSYHLASFQRSSSCSVLDWRRSIQRLKDKKIYFVGDSLMAQHYISAQCMYESLRFPTERNNVRLLISSLLRPDKPCFPECFKNPSYTTKSSVFPCLACPNGILYKFNASMSSYPHFWLSKIPDNITALIIGTGAWYNSGSISLQKNPLDVYKETIDGLAPYFHRFIHEKKMKVFWVNLPPITHSDPSLIRLYGWDNFALFDSYAKERLTREGVVFIDSNRAVAERKRKDANISDHPFGLHWCNPGRSTIPEFINQAIFHLLAVSLDKEEDQQL
jgi:hypothetical protein